MELGILHSIIGEIWKPIKDFPNYAISNKGRVYSFTRSEAFNKVVRMRIGKHGYYYVMLCKDSKVITKKVHRLVAENFLPNVENLDCVNHRDECRTNNAAENLEWCTTAYNVTYGGAKRKVQEKFVETGWSKAVEQYDKQGNLISTFSSIAEAARRSGCSKTGICSCCRGNRLSNRGFIWKYKEAV